MPFISYVISLLTRFPGCPIQLTAIKISQNAGRNSRLEKILYGGDPRFVLCVKYYSGDQINKDEMDGTLKCMKGMRNVYTLLTETSEITKPSPRIG